MYPPGIRMFPRPLAGRILFLMASPLKAEENGKRIIR